MGEVTIQVYLNRKDGPSEGKGMEFTFKLVWKS
jgi:hypothetical protein